MSSVAIFAVRTTQLAKASNIDPYDGVAASRSEVDLRRLHHALRLQLKILRGSLIPESLHRISSPYFRYCRKCLHRGYHGVVHQLETVTRCPIHGTLLEVECCECRAKTPYRLSANLLDAPIDVDAVATCMDPAVCPLERNSLLAKRRAWPSRGRG